MKKVLIIDDEEKLRNLLAKIISLEGFEVLQAADCKSGLKKAEQPDIDVVLCDVKLPDGNGVDLAKQIKLSNPLAEIILLTAYGNIPDGVQAIKNGAFDYITKGDDNNKIIPLLYRAMEKVELAKRIQVLQKQLGGKHSFDTIIGKSKPLQQAIDLAKKVSATDTTVLLTGETGTGKEVFAQAIHNAGVRANQNFIAINCSAFGKDLLESEMFGHKAGAFTGAVKDKKGLFEEAHQGTIFLDEVGEMNMDLQTKLLRVLETKEFIKVGDTKTIKVNVRVIAATNRDLGKDVDANHFRSDLYYRLAVFQIPLPPLRERSKDIEALANHFIQLYAAKMNKAVPLMSDEFLDKLKSYSWKGNIRELKNILERTLIMCDNMQLSADDLPLEVRFNQPNESNFSSFDLALIEKHHIQKVLAHTKGNKTEAARLMNIGLTTLYRKLEEYKI